MVKWDNSEQHQVRENYYSKLLTIIVTVCAAAWATIGATMKEFKLSMKEDMTLLRQEVKLDMSLLRKDVNQQIYYLIQEMKELKEENCVQN